MTQWKSTRAEVPSEAVLVWTGGAHRVAHPVRRPDGTVLFMDAQSDCVLEWPSHWMPLPSPPDAPES